MSGVCYRGGGVVRVASARPWWTVAPLGLLFLFVLSVGSVSAGDPVPGIDISLEEIPGGRVRSTTADKSGYFLFDRVAPGRYLLRLGSTSLAKGENHNSRR